MNLSHLFKRKLLIVSGKGGVGKTTVAATLGLVAAKQGLKTLIVEWASAQKIPPFFGQKKFTYEEKRLGDSLFHLSLNPKSAFEEYVIRQIHTPRMFRFLFENRFVYAFLNAAPGLNELLMIGKVWMLIEDYTNLQTGDPIYDLVILDAPATGHALALLEVPEITRDIARVGPLKDQAGRIANLLSDHKKTALVLVSLPEEMPIHEAIEIEKQAAKLKIQTGAMVLNAVFPEYASVEEWAKLHQKLKIPLQPDWLSAVEQAANAYQKRFAAERLYINKLKTDWGPDFFCLPYLFKPFFDRKNLEELAERFENTC